MKVTTRLANDGLVVTMPAWTVTDGLSARAPVTLCMVFSKDLAEALALHYRKQAE